MFFRILRTRKTADAYNNLICKMEVTTHQEEDQTGETHTMVENGTDDIRCGNVTGVWGKIMLTVIFVIDVEGRGPDSSKGHNRDSTTHSRGTGTDEQRIRETKEEISIWVECIPVSYTHLLS